MVQPILKGWFRDLSISGDALDRLTSVAVTYQNGKAVGLLEVRQDIFGGRDILGTLVFADGYWGASSLW